MIWLNMFAVWRAGGWPVRLRPSDPIPDDIDGALIGGGDDIDARLYDDAAKSEIAPAVGAAVRVDPARDRLELKVLAHAEANGLPVMGICRGAQMINVWGGGSLIADIYTSFDGLPEVRTIFPHKSVTIEPGSRLESILETDRTKVNAMHHQAVDDLGDDMQVSAIDDHAVIQGIESEDERLVVGVQWHPEFLIFDRAQQRLFRALVRNARSNGSRRVASVGKSASGPA